MTALQNYARLRDQLQPRSQDPSFFVSLSGKRLLYAVVSQTYRQLVDDAGVGAGAPRPPRLHDLRHSFAVATLLGWYRTDEDVAATTRGGVSEDQVFELAVCAAYGAATRQLDSALAALDAVPASEGPA